MFTLPGRRSTFQRSEPGLHRSLSLGEWQWRYRTMKSQSVTVAAATGSEPITLAEAKKQLEIATDDAAHDVHIQALIEMAREVVEDDTGVILNSRSVVEKYPYFPNCFQLRHRMVNSITSITYYDSANASQTFASGDYSTDLANGVVLVDYDATIPATYDRWDAVTVTYSAGYTQTTCPKKFKQMLKLLVGYYFERRNMTENEGIGGNMKAYESMIKRELRSTYP